MKTMKILILEDESLSAEYLSNLLRKYDKKAEIETLDSLENAYSWFLSNPQPDLLMADIHLADGLSLDLFQKINITSPVIFTTAFEQYAIDAFKVNSVDYLLKPFNQDDLSKAMRKYQSISFTGDKIASNADLDLVKNVSKKHKNRFLVKVGSSIIFKNTDEIAYFFADDKLVYLVGYDAKNYIVDYRLEQLEDLLDPHNFYRINRKFMVNINAIQKIKSLFNSRLQVFLKPSFEQEIYISKEKVSEFKSWLDQ
jgi:two-component system, LytTR family, response regulator LytT